MAKRLKTITAGRLVVVGCYTIPTPRSTERENCFLISDKARCIAGSVLELVCAACWQPIK